MSWRERLREAIDRSGTKHSVVARDAGITPESLSRVLTSAHQRPSLDTITRIAHAVNANVGWVLGEKGFDLSASEWKRLREVVRFLDTALLHSPLPVPLAQPVPNVLLVGSRPRDVPRLFRSLGARVAFQITDDSLRGAGLVDGDTVFVKPEAEPRECHGHFVVCKVSGELYAKELAWKAGHLRLQSRNERFAPLDLGDAEFELIGVVVGRLGALAAPA